MTQHQAFNIMCKVANRLWEQYLETAPHNNDQKDAFAAWELASKLRDDLIEL